VVHGEPDSARTFCDTLEREKGFSASVPRYGEEVVLD